MVLNCRVNLSFSDCSTLGILERFNLEDQVNHAVDFVREIVQPTMGNKTLKVIGHSIGAYIGAA